MRHTSVQGATFCRPVRKNDSRLMPQLTAISRFPLKGLGPDTMTDAELVPGRVLPWDRAWAIENGGAPFDADNPAHLSKKHFLMLAGQPALAGLTCRFDETAKTLQVQTRSQSVEIALEDPGSHAPLFKLLQDLLGDEIRGELRIIHAPEQAMTDIPQPHLSLINTASVRNLADKCRQAIAPLRFRGNLLIDGAEAWSEFDWVGKEVRIGDARFRVDARIRRCAATSVNPALATRDINVPKALFEHYGHMDCGLYLDVIEGGRVRVGDPIEVLA